MLSGPSDAERVRLQSILERKSSVEAGRWQVTRWRPSKTKLAHADNVCFARVSRAARARSDAAGITSKPAR
jgi:hypothetical protein